MKIRPPAVSDLFYPAHPQKLKNLIEQFLAEQTIENDLKNIDLKAFIVPHAGYVYSGSTAAAAYKYLRESRRKPKKIICVGPSHQIPINQFVFCDFDFWETPLGKVKILPPPKRTTINNLAFQSEHSLEVQLPFLILSLFDFEFLPILINETRFSQALAEEIKSLLNKETLLIVSSDLSHYHPLSLAKKIDEKTHQAVAQLDIEAAYQIEACGQAGVLTLLYLAKEFGWKSRLIKYQTSYETNQDESNVVGYGAYLFFNNG